MTAKSSTRAVDFREILRSLEDIHREILSEPDVHRILKDIAEAAMRVFHADACRITRYDSTNGTFSAEASTGLAVFWAHEPRAAGIGQSVLNTGRHYWESHTDNLNPEVRRHGIRCVGVFPLRPDEDKVGLLYLHFRDHPDFTLDEINLVYHFSYNAGLAIQLAELRANDARRINDLNGLRDAGVEVSKASTLYDSLTKIVNSTAPVVHADASIVYPWDNQRDEFCNDLVVNWNLKAHTFTFSPARRTGLTHAIMRDGIEWEHDTCSIASTRVELIRNLKENILDVNQFRSFIGIALKSGDDPLGVLYVFFRNPHSPNKEELTALEIFADMAATRIQLAHVVEAQQIAADALEAAASNSVASQFIHRLGNVAGTIPMVVNEIEALLEDPRGRDQTFLELLRDLRDETRGVLAMCKQVQDETAGQTGPVDICKVVEAAVRRARVAGNGSAVTIHQEFPAALPKVIAAELLLTDVLVNLLQNAAEAGATDIDIHAVYRESSDVVELAIADNGHGIQPSHEKKIFTPLFSTKKGIGHGVGLWTSRNQIIRMGGRMTFTSEVGKGTTFTISLKIFRNRNH